MKKTLSFLQISFKKINEILILCIFERGKYITKEIECT